MENVIIKNVRFQVWDLGGQSSIRYAPVVPGPLKFGRRYWKCYYANTDGIVFVIDSADIERLMMAKAELGSMLEDAELKGVSLLIIANKQVGPRRGPMPHPTLGPQGVDERDRAGPALGPGGHAEAASQDPNDDGHLWRRPRPRL